MTERKKKGCNEIGFVEPNIVFQDPVTPKPNWKPESKSNLMKFLVNQRQAGYTLPLQLQVSVNNVDHRSLMAHMLILVN
jgi:hypothetical protein